MPRITDLEAARLPDLPYHRVPPSPCEDPEPQTPPKIAPADSQISFSNWASENGALSPSSSRRRSACSRLSGRTGSSLKSRSGLSWKQQTSHYLGDDLVLPDTQEVREHIKSAGDTVTFLSVASSILERFEVEVQGAARKDELNFVRQCLHAGREQSLLPCALNAVVHDQAGETAFQQVARVLSECDNERAGRISLNQMAAMKSSDSAMSAVSAVRLSLQSRRTNNQAEKPDSRGKSTRGTKVDKLTKVDSIKSVSSVRPACVTNPQHGRGAMTYTLGTLTADEHSAGCPWLGPEVPRWPTVEDPHEKLARKLDDMLSEYSSWDFDIFELARLTNDKPLQFSGWKAMCGSGCFSEFPLVPDRVRKFLRKAEDLYSSDLPYHNNVHAADVTQSLHALLRDIGLRQFYDPMDTFASLFAAIIHDIGHDGRNNNFHVNVQDDLALTYNDKSVQENYHLSVAFKLVAESESTNIFEGLTKDQSGTFRREVIEMVLSTDMVVHFSAVGEFSGYVERLGRDALEWQEDSRAMTSLRNMMLHCADVSNQAKSYDVAQAWSKRCLNEFFAQGDEEKRLLLPVSPLCDRGMTDIPRSQIGFIQYIVQPTYATLAILAPRANERCMIHISSNLLVWETRRDLNDEEMAELKASKELDHGLMP